MIVEQLDGRFKWYKQGFRYRVVFGVRDSNALKRWIHAFNWLEQTYGKERGLSDDGCAVLNEFYRIDMPSKRCRQVYLHNERELTMLLLVMN